MPRHVWVRHQSERDVTHDDATICPAPWERGSLSLPSPDRLVVPPFAQAFQQDYPRIRRLLNDHPRPGLGLFVSGADGLEASAWVPCGESGIEPVVIGRHSHAELFLPADVRLSLRHLVVVVHPGPARARVRFRVLDLRTSTAFADEEGHRLEALESEGPLMLRCASFALLLLPTADTDVPWPESAAEAWERIPGRVYLEGEPADPDRWLAPLNHSRPLVRPLARPIAGGSGPPTLASTFPGPVFPSRALESSGPARGELVVRSESGRVSLKLGAEATRRGVLLGRYERCDTAGLPVLSADGLSRVHLLVVEIGQVLYAVDTASTNGTWLDARRVQFVRMEPGISLSLAGKALVEWRFYH